MTQNNIKRNDFTEGKILSPLIRFVFPILFAMLIQSLYGAVDLLIVGQFSDAANVSAVSVGSQLMHSMTLIITDLAVGTTVLLGQFIGQKKSEECGRVVGTTICIFTIIGIVLAIVMQPLVAPVAAALNAPAEAFSQTVYYIRICCGGAIFIVAYNILGSIFRGIGDSKMPLITVLIAAAFNVAGDLLLVAVFGMGASGAAIATVMAQGLSVLLSFVIIRRKGVPFTFKTSDIKFHRDLVGRVLVLGLPIAFQDLLVSMSFLVIMAVINKLGVIASAGIGVAEKLCGFIMLLPSAFSQAMSSFVAQNYGARKMRRAEKALASGIALSFVCSLFLGYLAFFHGAWLSTVFSRDAAVCVASGEYLKGYGIDCLQTAFLFCFIGYFNGCQKTRFVLLQGIVGAFGVRVPLCILFSRMLPVSIFRISLATPASSLIQNIMCVIYFLMLRKSYLNRSDCPPA